MSPRITAAIAVRVLQQLRHDRRTVALLLVVPCLLMTLLWWIYIDSPQVFDQVGGPLLVVFPFTIMFLITSVTTLAERTSGTLERLLAMPMNKVDFLLGYALAFAVVAVAQSALTSALAVWLLDLSVAGSVLSLMVIAVLNSVLGTALGLLVSAFAQTDFQAVQFMPAFVVPQILLCGLIAPRDQLPDVLHAISAVLPLSYSVDAINDVTADPTWTADLTLNALIVTAFALGALILGAATLRRRSG
ncbi:MAG: ABC transporter permease [Ornithinimicrobium sp.]